MRIVVRCVLLLACAAVPARATQYAGEIVGTVGESDGSRFSVMGATHDTGRTPMLGPSFAIAPLSPSVSQKIFRNGFE
jgi:hypothetical protein